MQQSENAPLAGRVAVVTGASRGIGAAIARRLTRAGGRAWSSIMSATTSVPGSARNGSWTIAMRPVA